MKTLSFTLLALMLIAGSQPAFARTYDVKYMGEGALKGACAAGGGSFNSGTSDYACTYKNGNIRDCNRETKKCITSTPKIEINTADEFNASANTLLRGADTSAGHGNGGDGGGAGSPGNPKGGTFNPSIGNAPMSQGGGGAGVVY